VRSGFRSTRPEPPNITKEQDIEERRIMLGIVKSELKKHLAVLEENARISTEYKYKVIRVFLTVPEAQEIIAMIKEDEIEQSPLTH